MKNRKQTTKYVLYGLLAILLFLPMIQRKTGFVETRALKGVFEPTPKPELTFGNCKSGSYQTQIEKYLSENFGFREPLIRFYNQYAYSFFNTTHCHFITPGKNGYLFYDQAVNDYFGTQSETKDTYSVIKVRPPYSYFRYTNLHTMPRHNL